MVTFVIAMVSLVVGVFNLGFAWYRHVDQRKHRQQLIEFLKDS